MNLYHGKKDIMKEVIIEFIFFVKIKEFYIKQ